MNANITRGALALASLAMALLARPVSANAGQDQRPKQVAEKVVPVYNPSAIQRGKLYCSRTALPVTGVLQRTFRMPST